jgi:hypothetical protein
MGRLRKKLYPIPRIDDLALHNVVVIDAFHLGIDWFPRVMVQSHDQSTIMLVLSETSHIVEPF